MNETKSKVILCIDDDANILENLKIQLRNHFGPNYSYETILNPFDALELVDELVQEGFQNIVIVSDWLMEGLKGDDLLIKIHQKYPSIIKIMLTGYADNIAIERAKKNANLFACIQKPWEETLLINTITSAIEKNS